MISEPTKVSEQNFEEASEKKYSQKQINVLS